MALSSQSCGVLFVTIAKTLKGRCLDCERKEPFTTRSSSLLGHPAKPRNEKSRPLKEAFLPPAPATAYSDENRHERSRTMEIKLAEAIVEACGKNGIRAVLQENYSASWMRGRKTTGVVIVEGDLAQVVTAVIANPHFFIDGELPRFNIKNNLCVSTFRLSLILY